MIEAFSPSGPTIKVAADAAAPLGIQAPVTDGSPQTSQFRIMNASAVVIHVAKGKTAAEAQANAVIATGAGANSKLSWPLGPGAIEVVACPGDFYWSAIAAGPADLFITPGRGL